MLIRSNRCASLQVDPIIFNIRNINSKFSQWYPFHLPKLPLFSRRPTLFLQWLIYFNQVSIYSCEVSSLFSINVLIWWSLVKMLTSFKFIILRSLFFSGGFNSSFVDHILSSFQMFSHAGTPLNHSLLDIPSSSSVEYISEGSSFHSRSVQAIWRLLSHSSHLIQSVQSLFKIVQRCFLWVGPNPQVFSQDLTWLF